MASIVTFRDDAGEARGRILTLSDISEVRRLAMEKQTLHPHHGARARARSAPIKGLLEVVIDKSLGDELDPYIPMIDRADHRIDNLVELIGDLLTLARIEQAPEGEEPELVPVAPVLHEVVELARERWRAARHHGRRPSSPPDLPPALIRPTTCDGAEQPGRQRRQVQPRRRHRHRARRAWRTAGCASTSPTPASASGAENLGRLFDEFFREKRDETRELEGNGLGL